MSLFGAAMKLLRRRNPVHFFVYSRSGRSFLHSLIGGGRPQGLQEFIARIIIAREADGAWKMAESGRHRAPRAVVNRPAPQQGTTGGRNTTADVARDFHA